MMVEAIIEGRITKMKLKDKGEILLSLECRRKDGRQDFISAIASQKMISKYRSGDYLTVAGELYHQGSHRERKIGISRVVYSEPGSKNLPDMNLVHIVGEIVTDPRIRIGNNNTIAMDVGIMAGTYLPCVAFNNCTKTFNWIRKGSLVNIWGRLNNRSYYSTKRKKKEDIMEITITNMTVLDDEKEA